MPERVKSRSVHDLVVHQDARYTRNREYPKGLNNVPCVVGCALRCTLHMKSLRIEVNKKDRKIAVFLSWCSGRDLNSHDLRSLPPQDSVSTNSTTRAFILFLFLIAEYHYFCFQLLEQLVVAVVELVQQFEINRQMNLFVRYHGES